MKQKNDEIFACDMDGSRASGKRLRHARKQAHLSVEQLARRAGYSPSGVRAIENGQNGLRPGAAETFASVLGVATAWLLAGAGEQPRSEESSLVPIIGHVGADALGTVVQAGGG
jgi:transcriptional regulator with XRE-family HTH domain